jgi:hypothetical protein
VALLVLEPTAIRLFRRSSSGTRDSSTRRAAARGWLDTKREHTAAREWLAKRGISAPSVKKLAIRARAALDGRSLSIMQRQNARDWLIEYGYPVPPHPSPISRPPDAPSAPLAPDLTPARPGRSARRHRGQPRSNYAKPVRIMPGPGSCCLEKVPWRRLSAALAGSASRRFLQADFRGRVFTVGPHERSNLLIIEDNRALSRFAFLVSHGGERGGDFGAAIKKPRRDCTK